MFYILALIQLFCYAKPLEVNMSHWANIPNDAKATLLLGWSHSYKNYMVVITIGLTVTKYPYLKWQWIFYFLHRYFVSSITAKTFYQNWLYIWVTQRVSYKKQELLTLHEHLSSPMSNLDRGPSIGASYQVSVHLAMRFQRRRFLKISQSETRIACGGHVC